MSDLNITGLPPLINALEKGRVYCITVQSSSWFDLLMSHITGNNNTLLTFRNVAVDYPNVVEKYNDKQIDIITVEQKSLVKLSKKISRLVIEFSQLGIKNGALYIDASEQLLAANKNNEQLITELKHFAKKQNVSIVLLFSEGEKGSNVQNLLTEHRTDFYGVMKFEGEIDPNMLQIDIWYTETGCVVNQNYRVQNLNGRVALTKSDNINFATEQFEKSNVIVDENHTEIGVILNRSWELAKDQNDLFRLVKENPSATVIIHGLNSISLKDLAKKIYKLRQLAGENLKVIVLEVNVHLRMTEQNILRCLGANLILPRKIQINTLTNIISATENLVFVGDLTADFYDIYDEELMPSQMGYLAPNIFKGELEKLSHSSKKYGISSSLIILKIPSGIAAMDTIKYAKFQRHGDIYCIIDNFVYIYLFGCRDEDINVTLTHILGAEPLLIFSSGKRYVTQDAIALQIMKLHEYIENNPVVDFHSRIVEFTEHKEKMESMRSDKMDYFEINVAVPANLKLK